MAISSKEMMSEKRYLEDTKEAIKEILEEKKDAIEDKKKMVLSGKKHLWQNMNDYNSVEMYNKMDEEDLNVSIINGELAKVAHLERSILNPYFGRVDFKSESESESIYIGLTTVDRDKTYVYDWRAPISNLYYNFGLGIAHYDTPDGRMNGTIDLKRQYKIEMGNLINAFETEVALEDEMLQEVLLSSSDDKMKNIVSTIQREQNEIIRFGAKRNLIIEGIAGSGKTSVALHRIAYLLYNQKNLTNKNVMILSPNDIFTNYISNVLPELGEENVDAITKEQLVKKYLKNVEFESLSEFIERFYSNKDTLSTSIKYKFSKSYIDDLDKFICDYRDSLTFTKKIGLKKKFITSSELNDIFKRQAKKLSLSDRITYTALKICDLYDISEDKNLERLEKSLREMLGIISNPLEAYEKFLDSREFKSDGTIKYEDLSGILYLYFELNGYPSFAHIKHVIVDEAQDYSELDFRILRKLFKSAVFTILGDTNQAVNPYLKYDSLSEISSIFDNSSYEKLDKTYRSSSEIIEFTNRILGIKDIKSVRVPTNREVELKESHDYRDILNDIKRLKCDFKRIAIITKTREEAKALYDKIGSKEIGLMESGILKEVTIVPSYLAKGLEFEAVIIYTDGEKFTDRESNLYYVSATRAQHALIVYNQ